MLGMKKYRDIYVAKGSQLYAALEIPNEKERSVAAKKIYDETTKRYEQMYSKEDREWFSQASNDRR